MPQVHFPPRDPSISDDDYYVNEEHIQSFARALNMEDNHEVDLHSIHSGASSPAPSPAPSVRSMRVRKVSALSDFAPVNMRVRRRRKGLKRPVVRQQEWLFILVRWPLLLFIFLFICLEFSLYILIRQCVNAKEWFTAWRGRKGLLRKRLRAAQSYDEWKDAAAVLDDYLQFDDWKAIDDDPFYDWRLVRKVLRSLRSYREQNDVRSVLGVLETCIRTNFAGVESARLYSETFYGTKRLIEMYITEVEKALTFIRESPMLSNEEKRRFFKSANTNLGVSALCLSGGASFAYYHFGVLKAFVKAKLLPRIMTGTSAGGLVAALACTRTDAELEALLTPELADKITACEEPFGVWFWRFLKTGARFDSVLWARKACFFTRGSMTFKEAYLRTGRILNISVIPADRHSPTKLLNYITAPDTVIWSALLASAAVPGILNPVVLMQKTRSGELIPWNWGSKFKDGSLRVDIPLQALNSYFNVTHPVVSQVNPHVHLFFFAPRGSAGKPVAHRKGKGKGWRGNFLLSAAEQWLKLELTKNFKFIRDLDLLPQLLGQDWSSVFLQRFDGTVTIWPKTRFLDWVHILSDPDRQEMERMMHVGESVTWPKLHMIENRYRIEREILRGRQAVRKAATTVHTFPIREEVVSQDPGELPDPSTGPPPAASALTAGDISTTEAENAADLTDEGLLFASNNIKSGLRSKSGSSTPKEMKSSQDPLRSFARRRRWASELFERDVTESPGGTSTQRRFGTPDPPPDRTPMPTITQTKAIVQSPTTSTSTGFLSRFRSASLHNLRSPFHAFRLKKLPSPENTQDDTWSTDSSDDDLPPQGTGLFVPPGDDSFEYERNSGGHDHHNRHNSQAFADLIPLEDGSGEDSQDERL